MYKDDIEQLTGYITPLEETHKTLQSGFQLLNGIIEGTNDLIAALDLEFRFIAFNSSYSQEFEAIFGKKIELGMSLVDVLAHLPENQAKALDMWGRALRGEEFTVNQEFGDFNLKRSYYEITYSSIKDENGKLIGASHIARDVSAKRRTEEEVQRLNAELEQRVIEHTTQLEATNQRLENEIAERKQLEEALRQSLEALRQSEERLRLVVQNMPVMIDAFNDNDEIILWNQECERVTGYSAVEIVGNPLAMELLYPDLDYRQQMMAAWKQHGNNYRDWEWQITCKDGSVKTTLWSNISDRFPIPGWAAWGIGFDINLRKRQQEILAIQNTVLEMIARGAPLEQVLNVLTRLVEEQTEQSCSSEHDRKLVDLSVHLAGIAIERQRASSALRQSEEFLRRMIDSSSDCIKVLDLTGCLLSMNEGGMRLMEIEDFKPYHNLLWTEFWNQEELEAVHSAIAQAKAGGKGQFQGCCPTAQGKPKWWEVVITPIMDASGKPEQLLAVSRDISERKQAEQQITELNQDLERRVIERTAQLEAANKELEAFSYSVSHDLRTPLRSIDGFSLALLERYSSQLDDKGKHYLQRVRAATQRMGQLIDDLLLLSRATRGQMQRSTVDLSAIVEAIAQDLQQTQPERAVEFIIAPGVVAEADPRLLRVALENLLNNAWKFTSNKAYPQIEFGILPQPDGTDAYFIRDNGAGFDMAYADKLFEAFQRLHTTEEFPGTGIGLAIVGRIVRRHGGRVWAEGAVGQGAIFYFTL